MVPGPIAALGAGPELFGFFSEEVLGTSLEVQILADRREDAGRAEAAAVREIDRLAAILSGHDPRSEFHPWQAGGSGPVVVAPELFELLAACNRWREWSGGAFDPRVHALAAVWRQAAARASPDRRLRRSPVAIPSAPAQTRQTPLPASPGQSGADRDKKHTDTGWPPPLWHSAPPESDRPGASRRQ
jgi:hypothetical protein